MENIVEEINQITEQMDLDEIQHEIQKPEKSKEKPEENWMEENHLRVSKKKVLGILGGVGLLAVGLVKIFGKQDDTDEQQPIEV